MPQNVVRAGAGVLVLLGLAFLAGTDDRGVTHGVIDALLRAGFWCALLLAVARLAARAVRSQLTGPAHLIWDGATGVALLIVLLIVAGLIPGGFRASTIRLMLGAIAAAGALAAVSDPIARFSRREAADGFDRAFPILAGGIAVAGLAWDRVPPLFFDTRAYHFALPEMWLIAGRIAPETWSLHSWFPPGMPVLFGAGMACGGERLANDANLVAGLGLLGMAGDVARRLFTPAAGILASLLALTLPLILYALAIPAADLGHGTFVFGALGCLLLRDGDATWTRRAALLTAGAVLTKYLGLVVPLAAGTVWIFATQSGGRWRGALRFALPSALALLPWLGANAIRLGNPIAPIASSVLPVRGLAEGGASRFRRDAGGGVPGMADVRAIIPQWITGQTPDAGSYPAPAFGWLPWLLLPVAVASAAGDRSLRRVLAWSAVLVAIWFFTFRWERFLIAFGALLAVALGGGVVLAARRRPLLRALPLLAGAAAVLATAAPLSAIARFHGGFPVAVGWMSSDAFLAAAFPIVPLFQRINGSLDPARDRVLFLGEMRHYGLAIPRCAPTGFNSHPLIAALAADPDPEAVTRALRAGGYTHVLVDPGWVARSASQYPSLAFLRERPELTPRFVASLGAPLDSAGPVALYRIPE